MINDGWCTPGIPSGDHCYETLNVEVTKDGLTHHVRPRPFYNPEIAYCDYMHKIIFENCKICGINNLDKKDLQ